MIIALFEEIGGQMSQRMKFKIMNTIMIPSQNREVFQQTMISKRVLKIRVSILLSVQFI